MLLHRETAAASAHVDCACPQIGSSKIRWLERRWPAAQCSDTRSPVLPSLSAVRRIRSFKFEMACMRGFRVEGGGGSLFHRSIDRLSSQFSFGLEVEILLEICMFYREHKRC